MFEDDRPIKPDPKYMEEWEQKQKQRQKYSHKSLKKGMNNLLPCYRQQTNSKPKPENPLTKAEIYEKIKQRNRQKFGEWQTNKNKQNKDKQNKKEQKMKNKLKPNQMTINYLHKKVCIDTTEYKKPGYVPGPQKISEQEQNKLEYKKMVDYMKRMYNDFEKEKEQFEKEKEYLKFKKVIENCEGIQIRPKINTGLNNGIKDKLKHSKSKQEINSLRAQQNEEQKITDTKIFKKTPKQNNIIQQTPRQSTQIHQFHYQINRLHEVNPFTIKQIHKYVKLDDLIPQNNKFYAQAKNMLQNQRNKGQVQTIKPKCTHGSIGANHSTCSRGQCTEKRITKFQGGWYEVWVAGQYRSVYNQLTGFKMVWYHNGDIKQQFSKQKIYIYQSAAKKVVQVKVGSNQPFWYYYYKDQLEMKDSNGNMSVIFADGRHQIIIKEEDNCN